VKKEKQEEEEEDVDYYKWLTKMSLSKIRDKLSSNEFDISNLRKSFVESQQDLNKALVMNTETCFKYDIIINKLKRTITDLHTKCNHLGTELRHFRFEGLRKFRTKRKMMATISEFKKNEEAKQEKTEKTECKICMNAQITTFLECGHVLCRECSTKINVCPFCKETILKKFNLYL